jgi:hypothetical protein
MEVLMSDNGSFRIRIVDEDGNGMGGVEVTIFYASLLAGYSVADTDSDGWAEFALESAPPWGSLIKMVSANDEVVGEDIDPSDGDTFSFTLS